LSVLYETHRGSGASLDAVAMLRGTIEPFRNPRFAAFVLQTGFNTGVFFVLISATAVIMKEQLGLPATDYGLYFLLFPLGFLSGNLISTRLGGRVSIETMVLAGSLLSAVSVAVQSLLLLSGLVSPLTLFVPGFFITLSQGLALASAQAGAMAMMPSSAGTA